MRTHWRREFWGLFSPDRKSTRLNSSHLGISYAVFCLKKNEYASTSLAQTYGSPWRRPVDGLVPRRGSWAGPLLALHVSTSGDRPPGVTVLFFLIRRAPTGLPLFPLRGCSRF